MSAGVLKAVEALAAGGAPALKVTAIPGGPAAQHSGSGTRGGGCFGGAGSGGVRRGAQESQQKKEATGKDEYL